MTASMKLAASGRSRDGEENESNMITLNLTIEQAAMLAEAMELATTLAHRNDNFDAFTHFNGTDIIYDQVPELSGADFSESYKQMDAALTVAYPPRLEANA